MTDEPESCSSCRFVEFSMIGPEPYMACRRYPRVIMVIGDEVATSYPTVHEGDWCGEYQPDTGPVTVGSLIRPPRR